ncbi:MAG: DedA family protein, partial [Bdellovibrionales bacterium]|nr:DedA family protein [Bdellovibrionales bacterium]
MLSSILDILQGIPGEMAFWMIVAVLIICGLGLPLPEEVPLFVAGYLAYTETVSLGKAIFFTTIAIVLGDSILFGIGHRFGPNIFKNKLVKRFLTPKTLDKVNKYFHRYGNRVVFVARFVAGVRAPVFLMAGVLKMPYQRFLLLDGIAALISAPLIVWATYHFCHYFGGETDQALKVVRSTEKWILTCVILSVLSISFYLYRRQKKADQNRDRTMLPPPETERF